MTDIWIVTHGEYSSYQVIAAFSTVEAADAFAKVSNGNDEGWYGKYCVERVDLDPPNPKIVQRTGIETEEHHPRPMPEEVRAEIEARYAKEEEERMALIESIVWTY